MQLSARLPYYATLMRLNKPIGILLLLWPTLWAIWLASHGRPSLKILFIFITGTCLIRSAGCIINDYWDRNFDGHVERTRNRPLASGKVTSKEAWLLAACLALLAFMLVLLCNPLTIALSFVGALLTLFYPLLKRLTHLPQFGLGVAFSWGVPMAFAATQNALPFQAWMLFLTCWLWPIIYDTEYAMVDRDDDKQIGIKSTAILFAAYDKIILFMLQSLFVMLLFFVGLLFHLHSAYFLALLPVALCFFYQQWLIKDRRRDACFAAFMNNHWIGLIIFMGIMLSYLQ